MGAIIELADSKNPEDKEYSKHMRSLKHSYEYLDTFNLNFYPVDKSLSDFVCHYVDEVAFFISYADQYRDAYKVYINSRDTIYKSTQPVRLNEDLYSNMLQIMRKFRDGEYSARAIKELIYSSIYSTSNQEKGSKTQDEKRAMTVMTDLEKLKARTSEIDRMLVQRISPSSEEFILWKTKTKKVLGNIYGKGSEEYKNFEGTLFSSIAYTSCLDVDAADRESCANGLEYTKAKFKAYIDELEEMEMEENAKSTTGSDAIYDGVVPDYSKVFIVHGHDGELKERVARLIEKQGIEAVILSEQANKGMTVIEKIEEYGSSVSAAICLFTPDDDITDGSKRARQNVIFETGYFYGKISRKNTIVVASDETMSISDLKGVVYVDKRSWELDVLKELRNIGYRVDLNKL